MLSVQARLPKHKLWAFGCVGLCCWQRWRANFFESMLPDSCCRSAVQSPHRPAWLLVCRHAHPKSSACCAVRACDLPAESCLTLQDKGSLRAVLCAILWRVVLSGCVESICYRMERVVLALGYSAFVSWWFLQGWQ